jgi:predicted Zn-dependent protease
VALDPISTLDSTTKVALLGKVEKLARAKARDPRVVQVMAGLASEYDVVMVARADGTLAADVRPLVRLSVTVIAEQKGRREDGLWRRRRTFRPGVLRATRRCSRMWTKRCQGRADQPRRAPRALPAR